MPRYSSGHCLVCGETSVPVAEILGVCGNCIREKPDEVMPYIKRAHESSRRAHGLPFSPPETVGGIRCGICSNKCSIGKGETGYCGLRWNDGSLKTLSSGKEAHLYSYLDPHVTNCCAAWFCPASTGAGYPEYAYRDRAELGYSNLAVFLYGCNFDCLFCQNPSHKRINQGGRVSLEAIASIVDSNPRISCICFFGGSPEPQLPFTISLSNEVMEKKGGVPLRICYEWNGCGDPILVRRAAKTSLTSGGNVKFDLKCFTPELSLALSGIPNRQAFQNFKMVAEEIYPVRKQLPVLTATTLLVTGYVDSLEVEAIAEFIADLDPSIPYSLLIFHPAYLMQDMPVTPIEQVTECFKAAECHLERVNVGNLHLLGLKSMSQFNSFIKGL